MRDTAEMKRLIREAALREGIAPSEWVRRRLREALGSEALGGEAPQPPAASPPVKGPS